MLPNDARRQHVRMPGESANRQPVAIELNPIETRDAVDVDELPTVARA